MYTRRYLKESSSPGGDREGSARTATERLFYDAASYACSQNPAWPLTLFLVDSGCQKPRAYSARMEEFLERESVPH